MVDDDEFSDGGFEDLNDTVLQKLEDNAIQFTQARHAQSQAGPRPSLGAFDAADDDLDDSVVIDNDLGRPFGHGHGPGPAPGNPFNTAAVAVADRSWETHHQQPHTNIPPLPAPMQSQLGRPPPPPIPRPFGVPARPSQIQHGVDPAKSSEMIVSLKTQVASLQNDLVSTKGEAAILRSKLDKESKGHQAELDRLRKQHAEQQAKQERAVEAALAAERTTSTELHFVRQDLDQELGRARTKKKAGSVTTPKKARHRDVDVGDGFDHVEVLPSPDRAGNRLAQRRPHPPGPIPIALGGDRTPTRGKRKRPVLDSPVRALEMQSDDVVVVADRKPTPGGSLNAADPQQPSATSVATTSKPWEPPPYDFVRVVLAHGYLYGEPSTLDMLGRFSFPSNPSRTLGSLILEKLACMGGYMEEPTRMLVDFCNLMLDMWHQCLSEKYYPPVWYLGTLIQLALCFNTRDVAPHILATLVPIFCTTCSLVAVPRLNSPTEDLFLRPDGAPGQQLIDGSNVSQSLDLLCLVSSSCLSCSPLHLPPAASGLSLSSSSSPPPQSPLVDFWQTMEPEFVHTMLSLKQYDGDVIKMLSLLQTSVLQDSVGPLVRPTDDQGLRESTARSIVDSVSCHFVDKSPWTHDRPFRQCRVRLAALDTLSMFATSPFGALQVAGSVVAIGRLVLLLHWAINRLYDPDVASAVWRPGPGVLSILSDLVSALPTRREERAAGRPLDAEPSTSSNPDGQAQRPALSPAHGSLDMESHADGEAQRPACPPAPDQLAGDGGRRRDESNAAPRERPAGEPLHSELDIHKADGQALRRASSPARDQLTGEREPKVYDLEPLFNKLVNRGIRLLHFLITGPETAEAVNIGEKLAACHGAADVYVIMLARLNYSEGLFYLSGIDSKVGDLANELLAAYVTPEKAEELEEFFGK